MPPGRLDERKEETMTTPAPTVTDHDDFERQLHELRKREKAHTREGDAIAAARRRLPMTEVPPDTTVVGPDGPVPFGDVFEGRDELVAYSHMFYEGKPWEWQCEGCTRNSWPMQHAADAAGINAYWTTGRGDEVMSPLFGLLDRTVYGRREEWEDSPEGWPQMPTHSFLRTDEHGAPMGPRNGGRPVLQWTRPGVTGS